METIEIELSRIFVKVVQFGSFSKAAEALQIPKSTVSKAVSKLEKKTGTKLLVRTTRSQTLTAAGRLFYETCLGPIQVLEDAQKSLVGKDTIISGSIRLTAPEDLGTYVISPIIGQFSRQYPDLTFDLQYTNQVIDLVKEGFDLAIRIGKLEESQLRAKFIGYIELVPVAAPGYLKQAKKIQRPEDLSGHSCLSLSNAKLNRQWILKNGKRQVKIPVQSHIQSNQMTSLLQIAVGGGGILLAPNFLCQKEILSGQLIRILPQWSGQSLPVSVVSPVSIATTARLKVVSEKILSAIRKELEQ